MVAPQNPPAARRRGTKIFALAMLVSQMCALGRYLALARILGPEQLGIAATLILTAQFLDAVTDSGGDRFLINNPDGGSAGAQSLVQLVAATRGIMSALALVLLARPVAGFFKTPDLAAGLSALAIVPFIGGWLNFDFRKRQREHDFGGEAWVLGAAEIASIVATIIAALAVRDFTAVIYGLSARASVMVIVSHAIARTRYSLIGARRHAGALWRFGLPLMANGLLLFFGAQADRLLVGRISGLTALGLYSVVLLPISFPMSALSRFVGGIYLPRLAAGPYDRNKAYDEMGGTILLLSIGLAGGFALIAPVAIPIIFGNPYRSPAPFIVIVGIFQTIRLFRAWPTNGALGIGESRIVLAANLVRLIGLPLAIIAAVSKLATGPMPIVLGFTVGETLALVFGAWLVDRRLGRPPSASLARIGIFAAFSSAVTLIAYAVSIDWMPAIAIGSATLVAVIYRVIRKERVIIDMAINIAARYRIVRSRK